jgi:hypothetical protein
MPKQKGVIVAGTEAHQRTRSGDESKMKTPGVANRSDGKPSPKPKPKSKIIAEQ